MTWQRIEDDTYIDDTLVTCAEYQLFIDEMREQGEYYQPDHWTSYQFVDGQAQEPVVGIRYSDAEAFCVWLTERNSGEWEYRLSFDNEIQSFSVLRLFRLDKAVGYWLNSNFFSWVKSRPSDARQINFDRFVSFFQANAPKNKKIAWRNLRDLKQIIYNKKIAIDYVLYSDNIVERTYGAIFLAYFQSMSEPVNLGGGFFKTKRFSFDRKLKDDANKQISSGAIYVISNIVDFESKGKDAISSIKLVLDIFTLQERIAGRSPAFEGIRLVKERIK